MPTSTDLHSTFCSVAHSILLPARRHVLSRRTSSQTTTVAVHSYSALVLERSWKVAYDCNLRFSRCAHSRLLKNGLCGRRRNQEPSHYLEDLVWVRVPEDVPAALNDVQAAAGYAFVQNARVLGRD